MDIFSIEFHAFLAKKIKASGFRAFPYGREGKEPLKAV